MRTRRFLLLLALMSLAGYGFAQNPAAPPSVLPAGAVPTAVASADAPDVRDLPTLVVTGVQPGPGLWKVRKGDNVLWVLGTLSPLPRGIQWDSKAVEQALAQSQEVLASPSVEIKSNAGFFGRLALIPTAFKARRSPDGKTLQQLLGAQDYARWQTLKARYIGGDRGIEQWRPVFAALELYDKAIRKSGMRRGGVVEPVVEKLAKQYRLKTVSPEVRITIDNPKQALREFAATTLDDRECFTRTLDRIEGDLGTMVVRANAWSIGDVQTLREQPFSNQFTACSAAFTGAALARKHGIADLSQRIERTWIAAAEAALMRNRSTFATLPIAELLKPDGYLAKLQAKGYEVEAP
jgi:uncharacterized protein YbaP (TraB family)